MIKHIIMGLAIPLGVVYIPLCVAIIILSVRDKLQEPEYWEERRKHPVRHHARDL